MVHVAAAQLGPIQKAESRQAVVARMLVLMDEAHKAGANFIVYPELALTTFFPRYYMEDQSEVDSWFETQLPSADTQPLFDRARDCQMAMSLGYAELTEDGHHFNTSVHVDKTGAIVGKYRKVHLPGHEEFDPERTHQHLEKRYFEPGDLGFPVYRTLDGIFGMCICNDYNTPSVNSLKGEEGQTQRLFHSSLVVQAGAYQNSTWVVSVAKAGDEDGHPLIGGSIIVNPDGEIVAQATSEADELLVHSCDLDDTVFGKKTIFDFQRHRRIEHYGRITGQTGVQLPPE
jgi:predicted amidohydrolase